MHINVPELTLHFSDLSFKVGTGSASNCEVIIFRPYYFLRSTSAAYVNDLSAPTTTIDCSVASPVAGCYGGAGPALFGTTFGINTAKYFLTKNELSHAFDLPSINTQRLTNNNTSFISNVEVTNNLPSGSRGASYSANGVEYAGSNKYYDYVVACADAWANTKYQITLVLGDEDTPGVAASTDEYFDWGL